MTSIRIAAATALALAALALTGCSAGNSIDIPDAVPTTEPQVTTPPEETVAPEPIETPTAVPVDCAGALPGSAIEERFDLPSGWVTVTDLTGTGLTTCAYTIAGNGSALTFDTVLSSATADEQLAGWTEPSFAEENYGGGTLTETSFADAAVTGSIDDGSVDGVSLVISTAGGYAITATGVVGSEGDLEAFSRDIYASLGVEVEPGAAENLG